jgi:5-methylcytosine-specific restriction enzyme B
MREEAATEEGLERIWRYDILPLLEEHYYGRLTRGQVHERFGLDSLRVKSSRAVVPGASASQGPHSEGLSDDRDTE